MEQVFSIVLIVGLLLFFCGYLYMAYTGFKRHPVTGFMALVPVVNLLVLPTVWREAKSAIYASLLGAGLIVGAWYTGADQQLLANLTGDSKESETYLIKDNQASSSAESVVSTLSLNLPLQHPSEIVLSNQVESGEIKTEALHKTMEAMPQQENGDYIIKRAPPFHQDIPLASFVFKTISLDNLSTVLDQIVRIETDKKPKIEGKILNIAEKQLTLEMRNAQGIVRYDVDLESIRKLEIRMLK